MGLFEWTLILFLHGGHGTWDPGLEAFQTYDECQRFIEGEKGNLDGETYDKWVQVPWHLNICGATEVMDALRRYGDLDKITPDDVAFQNWMKSIDCADAIKEVAKPHCLPIKR